MEEIREIVFDFFFRIIGETSYKNYKLKCELLQNWNIIIIWLLAIEKMATRY